MPAGRDGQPGHSTTRAAMIYLHTTSQQQRKIADGLAKLARAELAEQRKSRRAAGQSGTPPGDVPKPCPGP